MVEPSLSSLLEQSHSIFEKILLMTAYQNIQNIIISVRKMGVGVLMKQSLIFSSLYPIMHNYITILNHI